MPEGGQDFEPPVNQEPGASKENTPEAIALLQAAQRMTELERKQIDEEIQRRTRGKEGLLGKLRYTREMRDFWTKSHVEREWRDNLYRTSDKLFGEALTYRVERGSGEVRRSEDSTEETPEISRHHSKLSVYKVIDGKVVVSEYETSSAIDLTRKPEVGEDLLPNVKERNEIVKSEEATRVTSDLNRFADTLSTFQFKPPIQPVLK